MNSQTHCIRGHLFDEKNTAYRADFGWRKCRKCHAMRQKAAFDRKKDAEKSQQEG